MRKLPFLLSGLMLTAWMAFPNGLQAQERAVERSSVATGQANRTTAGAAIPAAPSLNIGPGFRQLQVGGRLQRPAVAWSKATLPPENAQWQPLNKPMPRTGFGTGYQWYRLPLSVSDTAARQLLLEIGLAQVPEATVFVQRGGLLDSFARAGTRWPFAQRALPYRLLAFPVAVQPGERLQLFVRLRGDGSNRSMPFMLWDQDRWLAHRRTRLTLNTAFFAVMSTIAVFGLIISVVIATPFRWPWFGFTLSGAGLTAVYTGLAHAWIWPGSSYAQLASPQLLANTTFFAGVALLQVLYRTRTEHPDLDRGFRGLRVSFLASAALALAMPVVPAPLRTLLFCANEGLFLTACAWILGSVWTLYRRQKRWEPLLMVVALAPQSLAISLHALQNLMLLRMGSVLFALDWMGVITVTFLLTLILLRRIRLLMDEGFQVVSDAVVRRRQNTYALLSRESEVRKAIGQDIDQRLGPLMDAAQRKLTAFRPPLHDLQEQLRAAQAEIRGICDNRIPSNLTEHGLLAALGEIIRPLEAAGTQVSCQYPRPRRLEKLDLLYQLVLFRIAQGLLNNVYKHAQARNVMLSMRVVGGRVFLDLRDDGVGFEPDRAGGGGRGLAIIRQRVETLGGTFAVQSRGGGGSFFQVQIPLKF